MATVLSVTEATMLKGNVAQSRDGKWTAQRIFHVIFESKPADHDEVCNATGIALGAVFKTGDTRTCSKRTPAALGCVTAYVVTLDYDVPDYTYDPNPLSRPDIISGKFGTREETYFLDCSDTPKPLATPTGEPYPELQKRKVGEFKFTVKGNRPPTMPVLTWAGYFRPAVATNDASITICGITFGAGVLQINDFSYEPKTENNYKFNECQWELIPNPGTWDLDIENRGFLASLGGITYQITLDDGITPPSKPWPLDTDGSELAATDTPSTTTYRPYPRMDFSVFNFTAAAPS